MKELELEIEKLKKENRILRQMYAMVFGGSDDALTLLEKDCVWEAKRMIRQALERSEELYVSSGLKDSEEDLE